MRFVVDILYLVALVLYAPVLIWRMAVAGKDRRGWSERFGLVPRRRGDAPLIWIHAVSVGEANAAATLVAALREAMAGCQVAFSTTTDTGAARLAMLYPQALRFRFPLDFSLVVGRVFRRIRPSLIVLMELEVWPNLLARAARAGVPVVVVNGRLSARSFGRYRKVRWLVRPMFRRLGGVCAQDRTYADRFAALGTPPERIVVTGSLKYDTASVAERVAGQDKLAVAFGLLPTHRLVVAGSTGPGEERMLLERLGGLRASCPEFRLAIVPRKPERFDEVADLVRACGFDCWRRSQHADGEVADADLPHGTVVLGDTMGELRKFYALSQVAFVGRSLAAMGGSDVMEAAALGRPVLVGPHTENFAEPVERLASAGGLRVVAGPDELAAAIQELLADEPKRRAMGESARQAVIDAKGATGRTVQVLRELMNASAQHGID